MRKETFTHLHSFDPENFHRICQQLADKDQDLQHILQQYGFPPMWTRKNTFGTLVHIILEQQVSLASALAALKKLKEKTKKITPRAILLLSDAEMKACFVSRQKTNYIRGLAQELNEGKLQLRQLEKMPDEEIRERLLQLKGIGNWTVDVYLMFVLQRADVFPIGDLAAVNALRRLKRLAPGTGKEQLLEIAAQWQPFRSVASMMLWHYYLSAPKPQRSTQR